MMTTSYCVAQMSPFPDGYFRIACEVLAKIRQWRSYSTICCGFLKSDLHHVQFCKWLLLDMAFA